MIFIKSLSSLPPSYLPITLISLGTLGVTLTTAVYVFKRHFRPEPNRYILISLPYSHYVELARWSLSLAPGDDQRPSYSEIKFPIGPHTIFVPIFRLAFGGTESTSSVPGLSSNIPFSPFQLQPKFFRKLMGLPFTIGHSKSYSDSWSTLEIANLSIDDNFKHMLDDVLGPAVRQVAYTEIFAENMYFYREIQPGVSPQRGMKFMMFLHDIFENCFKVTSVMRSLMALNDEQASLSSSRIIECLKKVDGILTDHSFLGSRSGSDSFGGADLAFSAIAAWVVLPVNPGGGEIKMHLLNEKHFGPKFIAFRERIKSHKAFQHVAYCYKDHR
ncbi:hypothetical protein TrLO_g826 [Triparma laevis f. longispina]|uniref:Uncharacterized protein n=1 Tax=Triparma laevis f. longispina TaxID=1714387 RepID=A0A9W6ZW95_9STRA|nr:hypothetical protein TrLO_g826 [Triparma laevis f. longispina]